VAPPDPIRAERLERRVRVAILAVAALLMLLGIHWGLPHVESWNGDDVSPGKPLRVVHDWLYGWHKYPYFHSWLNAFLYAPYVVALAALGQVDLGCFPRIVPHCFAAPERDLTVLMALSRLLSVAMGLGVVLGTERLARALHGDRAAALAAAAICAGSAGLAALSHTANLDVPVAFWFTLSMVAAARVWKRGAPLDHLAFGAAAGCALATKDAIAGAYVLPGFALAVLHVRRVARERGLRGAALARGALFDRRLAALAALPLAIYALVENAIGNPAGLVEHARFWIDGSEVMQRYRANPRGPLHQLWRTWLSLEAVLGAAAAALCLAAAALAPLRRRALLALWVPATSYAALGLAPNFVEPRLLVPMLPLLAAAGGAFAVDLVRRAGRLRLLATALLAAALVHELGTALNADLHLLRDPRYAAERWIAAHVPRGARIAALGGRSFLPRLERLGHAPVWLEPAQIRPGAFDGAGYDYAVLTEPIHPSSDKAWQQAVRDGRTDAVVVFDRAPRTPLDPWFGTRLLPGLTRPRVTVVRPAAPAAR